MVRLQVLKGYFSLLNVRPPGLWGGSGATDQDAQQEVLQLGQCSGEMLWCCGEQLLCFRLATVLKEDLGLVHKVSSDVRGTALQLTPYIY